jgi:hypothetical protein
LFSIIKNDEILINIEQMDETTKYKNILVKESSDIELDYDNILKLMKFHGWGDNTINRFEEFEKSDYYESAINDEDYADQMNKWLYEISVGKIKESINESFDEDLSGKLTETYKSLKRGILDLLDDTLDGDMTKLQDFINKYIDPESEELLDNFVEDADIFDFYLKYQSDVDQILLDNNYYDDKPGVESLYDYVIDGTFDAVVYCMEEMKKDLYEN